MTRLAAIGALLLSLLALSTALVAAVSEPPAATMSRGSWAAAVALSVRRATDTAEDLSRPAELRHHARLLRPAWATSSRPGRKVVAEPIAADHDPDSTADLYATR
ncbi:MAG: hypothetical protein JRI23_08915 [Deltaproteobacteria bacterium]|jgi:hypothetical protein|nr:hypothetical protein [Deltaproteobacteria bacterium]MBW2531758.1 hypothetical protein [Deltaproteobacteria bacterium]